MPKQTVSAIVSPRDVIAGIFTDENASIRLVHPDSLCGKEIELGDFFARFPDSKFSFVSEEVDAINELRLAKDETASLDFFLILFDSNTSVRIRQIAAKQLGELFSAKRNSDYVEDIVYARPLPKSADIAGALEVAATLPLVGQVVNKIVNCQERIRTIRNSWHAIRDDEMIAKVGQARVEAELIDNGVFKKLSQTKTRNEAKVVLSQLVFKLQGKCDPRILNKLCSEYQKDLPEGVKLARTPMQSGSEKNFHQENLDEIDYSQSHQKREQAEKQVSSIADLFGKGDDLKANRYLNELVESQSEDERDFPHLVKSLCNISSRCRVAGRDDISIKCLRSALEYRKGIDAVLYSQIGSQLRDLRKFDESVECFEKAIALDDGSNREHLNLEIIRVSLSRGDYEKALNSFLDIPDLNDRPKHLSSLGKVYRKLGRIRDARNAYWRSLICDPSYIPAEAGLAECVKQTGHYRKAIKRYSNILKSPDNLSEHANKVYRLALSFAYRLNRNFEPSEKILDQLTREYPKESNVKFQLAKLYTIMGRTVDAREQFGQIETRDVSLAALELYFTAIGKSRFDQRNIDEYGEEILKRSAPEEFGLVNCNRAFHSIRKGNFERAHELVSTTLYVDRLEHDFGQVLKFHATKKLAPKFNYKSDPKIARIAKRGYHNLKLAVHAIADDDFDQAIELEQGMGLVVAG